MNGQPRLRAPPGLPDGSNGHRMPPPQRPMHDGRSGMVSPQHSGPNGTSVPGAQTSRAEKFEDEKKRIIESCFSKKEPPDDTCELRDHWSEAWKLMMT